MKHITTIDYSVSGQEFTLIFDPFLQCYKTMPKPAAEDMSKYYESEDYISHTDAKRNFFEKIYHLVRDYSLKQKAKLIQKHVSKFANEYGSVLDIGCGTGDFLKIMQSQGWDVTGYEPNLKAAKITKSKDINLMNDLSYIPDGYYDVITMWHALEHVYDVQHQIKELHRMLKPDGVLIIAVPNFMSYDAQYYKSHWAAWDVPRHLWHFRKASIEYLFSKVKMEVVKVKPMLFDSFYVSFLSEKYKTGKVNFIKGFFIGLLSNVAGFFTREYSSHIYVIKRK